MKHSIHQPMHRLAIALVGLALIASAPAASAAMTKPDQPYVCSSTSVTGSADASCTDETHVCLAVSVLSDATASCTRPSGDTGYPILCVAIAGGEATASCSEEPQATDPCVAVGVEKSTAECGPGQALAQDFA